jgi:hypothetical protein
MRIWSLVRGLWMLIRKLTVDNKQLTILKWKIELLIPEEEKCKV